MLGVHPELDEFMLKYIEIMQIQRNELEKVMKDCEEFCAHYVPMLKGEKVSFIGELRTSHEPSLRRKRNQKKAMRSSKCRTFLAWARRKAAQMS
jgi:hypothetical protein